MKRRNSTHSQLNINSAHSHRTIIFIIMPNALNIYLFTAYVPTLSVYSSNNTLNWRTTCVMNLKGCERKLSLPKFMPFAGISLEVLKKVT